MSVKESITPEQLAVYTELVKEKRALRKKGNKGMIVLYLVCVVFGGLLGGFGIYFLEEGTLNLNIQPPFPIKDGLEFIFFCGLGILLFHDGASLDYSRGRTFGIRVVDRI